MRNRVVCLNMSRNTGRRGLYARASLCTHKPRGDIPVSANSIFLQEHVGGMRIADLCSDVKPEPTGWHADW